MKNFVYKIVFHSLATLIVAFGLFTLTSCQDDKDNTPAPNPPAPGPGPGGESKNITVDLSTTHQEMIGFGGALTWYATRVTSSPNKTAIADLIFDDLGIDIIRFKNWYYPDNYPVDKSTDVMTYDYAKEHWATTNELYELAKARNPEVKILLSSWGPPKALKSNDSYREGTLKKDNGNFMYDEFAQYWADALDHIPFDPDYISIQNEPTYTNSGWTTCQWAASETGSLPGYATAFDKVYDKIKDRDHVPVMIGPESQDLFTYTPFVNLLKDKDHCGGFAYHPYNVNSGTSGTDIVNQLTAVGASAGKPNIMTEFSHNLDWFNTAMFIQRTLIHANSSGYIYWTLAWAPASSGTESAMVSIENNGTYAVSPFYHLMKHFARHIDAGYFRVGATSNQSDLTVTAFKNPAGDKLTVIAVNNASIQHSVKLAVTGKTINAISGNQSKSGSYYADVTVSNVADDIALPAKSITTLVLDIN